MHLSLRGLVPLSVTVVLAAASAHADATTTFERIKGLAGTWNGIEYWSTNPDERVPVTITYYVTGRGSAVVENISSGTDPSMTSVYHQDGDALRMTHFCAAKNQPRLKADHIDEAKGVVRFSFVDITNLSTPTARHVAGVELRFRDDNHLTLVFTVTGDGKEIYEYLEVSRTDTPGSSAHE